MEVAHSVDSLVSGGVVSYEVLLKLDYKEINERYMSYKTKFGVRPYV